MLKKANKTNSAVLEVEAPIAVAVPTVNGVVYCPMCTHSVSARLEPAKKGYKTAPKQSCPRCSAALDAAFVIRADRF